MYGLPVQAALRKDLVLRENSGKLEGQFEDCA